MAVVGYIDEWDINGEEYEIHDKERGLPNGVATLDSNGRIPYSQLPESAIELKGYWDADTNTPELADGTGTNGDEYIVSVAGTQDLGSGSQYFGVGDRVLYTSGVWKNITSGFTKSVSEIPSDAQGNVDLTQQNDITKLLSEDLIAKYLVSIGSNWEKKGDITPPSGTLRSSIYSKFNIVNNVMFIGIDAGSTSFRLSGISTNNGDSFSTFMNTTIESVAYLDSQHKYFGVFQEQSGTGSNAIYNVYLKSCTQDPTVYGNWQTELTLRSNVSATQSISSQQFTLKNFTDPTVGETLLLFYPFKITNTIMYLTEENTWENIFDLPNSGYYIDDITYDENNTIYFNVSVYSSSVMTDYIYRVDSISSIVLFTTLTANVSNIGGVGQSRSFRHMVYNRFDQRFYGTLGPYIIGVNKNDPSTYIKYLESSSPTSSSDKDLRLFASENCPYVYIAAPNISDHTTYAGISLKGAVSLIYVSDQSYIGNSMPNLLYAKGTVVFPALGEYSKNGANFMSCYVKNERKIPLGQFTLSAQTEDTLYIAVMSGNTFTLYKSNLSICMQ